MKRKGNGDLGAENSNGILSTERNQITGSPRNVIHYSVASCSYKQSIHFNFNSNSTGITTIICIHDCTKTIQVAVASSRNRGQGGGQSKTVYLRLLQRQLKETTGLRVRGRESENKIGGDWA